MSRPLTLHLSALSDAEYDLYTSSLSEISVPPDHDIRTDKYWEDRVVSLREARGWMRGRYGVDGSAIDRILRYFSPTLGPADTLSAGQFFAAMRLVLYAQRGADPERSLVFVQPPATPRPMSTPIPDLPPPPIPVADKDKPPPPPPLSANPFQRSATISLRAPKTAPLLTTDPFSAPASSSGNPFLRNSNALPTPATSPTPSHFPLPPASAIGTSPPLPPRKPSFLPPPRHQALSTSSTTGSLRAAPPPPPKPANLSFSTSGATHMTSELMTKSLSAARALDVRRRAESELAGARMLEVIRSTTSTSKSPPGSTRPSPPASTIFQASSSSASETSSLERVATAQAPAFPTTPITTTRFPSPERERPPPLLRSATQTPRSDPNASSAVDDSPLASPTLTGAARPGRSKSVHSPTGSGPPPIPRRPRPESLQLAPGAQGTLKRSVSAAQPGHRPNGSIGGGGGADVMASLRESFGALGLQARDKIERMEQRMEKRLRTTSGRGVESERLVDEPSGGVREDVTGEDSDEERAMRGWRPLQ